MPLAETRIHSIRRIGIRPTYDLEEKDDHAYIGNGITVHNSGKDHTASSKLFWFAVENKGCQLAVVGPSFR